MAIFGENVTLKKVKFGPNYSHFIHSTRDMIIDA